MLFSLPCPHHQAWSRSQRSRLKKRGHREASRQPWSPPAGLSHSLTLSAPTWALEAGAQVPIHRCSQSSPDPGTLGRSHRTGLAGKDRLLGCCGPSAAGWPWVLGCSCVLPGGGGKGQNEVGELRFSRGCGPSCSPSLKAPRDSCLRPWGERGESQAGTGQRLVLEASLEVSQSGFWRSQPLTFWKPGGRPLGQEY